MKITNNDQMTHPLVCTPMDSEWKKTISTSWWATNFAGSPYDTRRDVVHMVRLLALRDIILTFGGEEVCLPTIEDDLDQIEQDSQFWYGDNVLFKKGQPSRCHQNIACYYLNNPETVKICTGYALSKDGMWRQHTWGLRVYKTKPDKIIESTVPRIAYYGAVLDDEHARQFADDVLY